MLFISLFFLFMKLTHIQVFKKGMHEARINLYFQIFIQQNKYKLNLHRDIVVYLKYDVKFT